MTTIEVEVKTKITLELTVDEAGALAAMCAYSPGDFLKGFHQSCGKSAIAPYENSLKGLFVKARMLKYEVDKVVTEIKKLPKIINID